VVEEMLSPAELVSRSIEELKTVELNPLRTAILRRLEEIELRVAAQRVELEEFYEKTERFIFFFKSFCACMSF